MEFFQMKSVTVVTKASRTWQNPTVAIECSLPERPNKNNAANEGCPSSAPREKHMKAHQTIISYAPKKNKS
ncbi:hypothetical protein KFK09_022311 [Dendrobium nobile]|uniref:Uncharacterized protein n=1 Tax=Dendrobium nobile TaxID=94219 RepID=A0A8T3AIY5_DENNO|nr:hypothetical protein KFK09_022311 [Dendrobium nobile]